jgi:hypothetical protein
MDLEEGTMATRELEFELKGYEDGWQRLRTWSQQNGAA